MPFVVLAVVILGSGALLLFGAPELVAMSGLLKFSSMPVPTPFRVTQLFHPPGGPDAHNGVDFGVSIGTPLLCVAPGEVVQVHTDPNNSSGMFVIVKGRLPYTPTIAWGYAHMSRIDVAVGQELDAGEVVGLSGNTGKTTGPHLHFTVLDVPRGFASLDPAPFLPEDIIGGNA